MIKRKGVKKKIREGRGMQGKGEGVGLHLLTDFLSLTITQRAVLGGVGFWVVCGRHEYKVCVCVSVCVCVLEKKR